MHRIEIFDTPVDVATMQRTVEVIMDRIRNKTFTQHVVVNCAKIVNMRSDKHLASSVRSSDIINIDGMGVVWGARLLGHDVPERVAGVDLFYELNKAAARDNLPVFYLGAKQEVVEQTASVMKQLNPGLGVAGFHHGYFWDDEERMVNEIKASGARLLFVAITSPKKEIFIDQWKDQLGVDFVMGVGGTFDVVAGKVKRAPIWMQNAGLEWLYRVLQEPRRMWKRYLVTNSKFLYLLLRTKLRDSGI